MRLRALTAGCSSTSSPAELLGLTATPERADGLPILAWFGDRIAAELRLWDAIEQHRLGLRRDHRRRQCGLGRHNGRQHDRCGKHVDLCDIGEKDLLHDVVIDYKDGQYQKNCDTLGYEPYTDAEMTAMKGEYDAIISRFGRGFAEPYGWAAAAVGIRRRSSATWSGPLAWSTCAVITGGPATRHTPMPRAHA
jgi:hypothetical protein